MQDESKVKYYADEWAYDLSIDALHNDGIVNEDVINQSIEMILATPYSSRLFNNTFGSDFSLRIFDNMSPDFLKRVLDDTVESIKRWEDRIYIIENEVRLNVITDENSLELTIPYIIKERKILGIFSKKIQQ